MRRRRIGEVPEWLKGLASKACRVVRLSWVRIPPSPMFSLSENIVHGPWSIVYGLKRNKFFKNGRFAMNKKILILFSIFYFSLPLMAAQSDRNNLQLRIDSPYFSPNDDGLQDQLFFQPVLQSNVEVKHWTVEILLAQNHRRVVRLSGIGFPALIKWDGIDRKGSRSDDGAYIARMATIGHPKTHSSDQPFWIDTQSPMVGINLSTNIFDQSFLDDGRVTFFPSIQDASPIDRWLLQVVGSEGHTAFVFWSSGPIANVQWDGKDRNTKVLVPQGDYRVVFQAWDVAGNESLPAFADFKANITPREMLGQSLHEIKVNETELGLIVQLNSQDLFQFKNKLVDFSDQGKRFLREVAILINAYPEATVKLDGYSSNLKNFTQDKDRASVYAWRVYSYLTKTGNVKPSRLNVRGRGRSPMFDRRSVGVPLLKNGVEIVLEGGRSW